MNAKDIFIWESEVRDSELDFQGIVNHANYFVYMMHARSKHIKSLGIDSVDMHARGFDLVLVHTEADFKTPLRSGDEFIVTSKLEPIAGIRMIFLQEIIRKTDHKTVAYGKNVFACIDVATSRPVIPEELSTLR